MPKRRMVIYGGFVAQQTAEPFSTKESYEFVTEVALLA